MTIERHIRIDIVVQRLEHIAEILDMEPEVFRWMGEQMAPEVYAPDIAKDHRPCLHPPGSPEKIATLRRRWAMKLELWNQNDSGYS